MVQLISARPGWLLEVLIRKKGVDYFDTYSPVTKIATIRALIAIAAIYDLVVHQMDVRTAFLNGDLEEEIYMTQPEGCEAPGQENKVCKLKNHFMV